MAKTQKLIIAMNSVCSVLGALLFLVSLPATLRAQELQEVQNQESMLAAAEKEAEAEAAYKGGVGEYSRWLADQPSEFLLKRGSTCVNTAREVLAKADILLEERNSAEVQTLTATEGQIDKALQDALNVYGVLRNRDDLTDAQQAEVLAKGQELEELNNQLASARGKYSLLIEQLQKEAEVERSNTGIQRAQDLLADAARGYTSAASVYSNAELDQAEEKAREAQAALLKAGQILTGKEGTPVIANEVVRKDLNEFEALRIKLQSILADIYSLRGQKEADRGEDLITCAILELENARRGQPSDLALVEQAIENLNLADAYKIEDELAEIGKQAPDLKDIITPSREDKLARDINMLAEIRKETKVRAKTTLDALMPDSNDRDEKVRIGIKSGQVYLQNGRYSEAREQFEQVLVEDPFNLTAIRALAKISEAMSGAANEKLEEILKTRIAEVRWKWSDPVTPLIAGSADNTSTQTIRKNDETNGLNKRLDDIVIQNLTIDNETLIDVLREILPREIQKADPEGMGINIVPMLTPPAHAGIRGYTPDGYISGRDGNGEGGGRGGAVEPMAYNQPMTPGAAAGINPNFGPTYAEGYNPGMNYGGGYGGYGYDNGMGGNPMEAVAATSTTVNSGEDLGEQLVNLHLSNITPREVLDYLSWQFSLRVRTVESSVIVAHPLIEMDPMETRFYNIEAGVFDALRTRSMMSGLSGIGSYDVVDDDDDYDDDDEDDDDN
ncbi:MAG: hypothetical protein J6Y80_05390, partial [Victivallales bacterium]|nr:hypothetical protein [Victivallales bacterium]